MNKLNAIIQEELDKVYNNGLSLAKQVQEATLKLYDLKQKAIEAKAVKETREALLKLSINEDKKLTNQPVREARFDEMKWKDAEWVKANNEENAYWKTVVLIEAQKEKLKDEFQMARELLHSFGG